MRLTVTMIGLGAAALVAACGGTNAPPLASSTSTSTADPAASTSTSTAASTSSTSTSTARPVASTSTSAARQLSSTSVSTARSTSSTRQSIGGNTPCSPSGPALKVSALNTMFNVSCLAAPAGRAFTIDFSNQEAAPSGPPHNVSIYTADPATDSNAKSLYQGKLIDPGQSIVYSVPALAAGTYYFNCVVHPTQMSGTFVVK
jgi:plastocyanin